MTIQRAIPQDAGGLPPPVITTSAAFARESSQHLLAPALGAPADLTKMTFATWVRRAGNFGADQSFVSTANTLCMVKFTSADRLQVYDQGGAVNINVSTERVFRDPTAWTHVVVRIDTTQATAANRVIIEINGEQALHVSGGTYPSQGSNINWASGLAAVYVSRRENGTEYLNGLQADTSLILGEAQPAIEFGEFNAAGVWVPKTVTLTYPANAFRYEYADAGNLGLDTSGNAKHATNTNGVTQRPDSPDDTYPIVNGVEYPDVRPATIERAGLRADATGGPTQSRCYHGIGTHGVNPRAGVSFYAESTVVRSSGVGSNFNAFGITDATKQRPAQANLANSENIIVQEDGTIRRYGTNIGTIHAAWGTVGDVVGVAVWNQGVSFVVNGNWQGGEPGVGTPHVAIADVRDVQHVIDACVYRSVGSYAAQDVNFGQSAFTHAPAGFTGWNTRALPASAIVDPRDYVETRSRTGTGALADVSLAMGGAGMSITKNVGASTGHLVVSLAQGGGASGRGLYLQTNEPLVEQEMSAGRAYRVQAPGRQHDGTWSSNNENNANFSDIHMLDAVVAGLDIVTYTGNDAAGRAVPHGLGIAPQMVWLKARSSATGWRVGHQYLDASAPWNHYLTLNTTSGRATAKNVWNDTSPDATNVYVGTSVSVNAVGVEYVMYVWADVPGFSAFGSYLGNGDADGPFISLDFEPEWGFVKGLSSGRIWTYLTRAMNPANPANRTLSFDGPGGEASTRVFDRLAGGFKVRTSEQHANTDGQEFIYAFFARHPFANIAPRAV